jgi:hypothetical protein
MAVNPNSISVPAGTLAGQRNSAKSRPADELMADNEALRSKHATASKAMALATLAMAAASALQALLYLRSFGVNSRTDGFFAAFALYAVFGIFSQSIRITSAPLLVGAKPLLASRRFATALAVIALPVLIITVPLAGSFAHVLAPGIGSAGQHVTERALPILGVAMVLQLWAAGAATLLAVRDRFMGIASAYCAGAFAGLLAYLALEHTAGELTLAWSMLTMAVVTFTVLAAAMRGALPASIAGARGAAPRALDALTDAGSILGRTGVYLAFNGLYLITLAFAGRYGTGDATVVSYAYLFASYLVAMTGFALGMARVADMTRVADTDQPASKEGLERNSVLEDTVPSGFRYAMLLSAPALLGLAAFGAPLAGAVLPSSLNAHEVETLQRLALLLGLWIIPAQLVNLLLPVMFARGRTRLVNVCAPLLVLGHLAATAVGAALFGLYGAVGAMFVAPACFAATMLTAEALGRLRPLSGELARDGSRFVLLAAASFGGAALITLVVPHGFARAALCGLIGGGAYLVGLRIFAASQLQMLLHGSSSAQQTETAEPILSPLANDQPLVASESEPAGAEDSRGDHPGAVDRLISSTSRTQSQLLARCPAPLKSRYGPVALLLLLGVIAMGHQWTGPVLWERDGLFYQSKVLELRGESSGAALHKVFYGPLGARSRQLEAAQPATEPKRLENPNWVSYSSQFYKRRLLLPVIAAAIYPLVGDRSLQLLSLLAFVLLGPLLYTLLRARFRPRTSLIVAAFCIMLPPVRSWSIFPITDSCGLALELLALIIALKALERGPGGMSRWLPAWIAVILALSVARDTAFIPLIAVGVVALIWRTRTSIVLTLSGIAAALPALLIWPVSTRDQFAYVFSQHEIPHNTSWGWVISHYGSNVEAMISEYAKFSVHHPFTVLAIVGGVALALIYGSRRDIAFQLVAAGSGLGYLALLVVGPAFSNFRYELVLIPLVALGFALGVERLTAYARGRASAYSPQNRGAVGERTVERGSLLGRG